MTENATEVKYFRRQRYETKAVCAWGPKTMEQTHGLGLKNRQGAGYAPTWPKKALPLTPQELPLSLSSCTSTTWLLHTLNLASSSQPFSNLQQVKHHGIQDRARESSLNSPAP